MLDRWYKVTAIAAALVVIIAAILGPSIGMVFWLAHLDRDVTDLQKDVAELQEDVTELQRGQAVILEILQRVADDIPEVRTGLHNHTHDAEGRTQLPLGR